MFLFLWVQTINIELWCFYVVCFCTISIHIILIEVGRNSHSQVSVFLNNLFLRANQNTKHLSPYCTCWIPLKIKIKFNYLNFVGVSVTSSRAMHVILYLLHYRKWNEYYLNSYYIFNKKIKILQRAFKCTVVDDRRPEAFQVLSSDRTGRLCSGRCNVLIRIYFFLDDIRRFFPPSLRRSSGSRHRGGNS